MAPFTARWLRREPREPRAPRRAHPLKPRFTGYPAVAVAGLLRLLFLRSAQLQL
jgi:hypothetical protein